MIKLTNNVSTNKIAYIPTKLNEISADFLKTITKTINLNNYQCLVALVTKTKLPINKNITLYNIISRLPSRVCIK